MICHSKIHLIFTILKSNPSWKMNVLHINNLKPSSGNGFLDIFTPLSLNWLATSKDFFGSPEGKKFFRHWTMSARKTRRPKQSSWSTVMHLAFWRPPQSTPCCFRQNPEEIIDREDRRKLEGCWLEANVSEEFLWCTSSKTYSIQRTSTKGRCCIQR